MAQNSDFSKPLLWKFRITRLIFPVPDQNHAVPPIPSPLFLEPLDASRSFPFTHVGEPLRTCAWEEGCSATQIFSNSRCHPSSCLLAVLAMFLAIISPSSYS